MNLSPSPGPEPNMGQGHRMNRQRSETPPAQPLSKRDKRRTALSDRLAEITMQFSTNRDLHYRQQLQGIQLDTALIMSADLNSSYPLEDRGEDIDALVSELSGGVYMRNEDGSAMGGRVYADFAREINSAIETRDASLVMHNSEYLKKKNDMLTAQRFKLLVAEEEHAALSRTLRDRLINSITSKKLRLEKEKGALDIADSNAILLHPNQFGIHNPASPGGMHSKRATRHRREAEDISNYADGHKRKRKGNDDDGSPAPSRRAYDNGTNTPVWNLDKAREAAKQFDSPLYSIDKLFTDKDLGMTYNNAATAAYKYILDHPIERNDDGDSNSDTAKDANGDAEDADDADSPPTAAPMAREYSHATRSTRGANFLTPNGIEGLHDISTPANYKRVVSSLPRLPPAISNMAAKRYEKESANSPAQVNQEEWQNDWAHIAWAIKVNEEAGQEGANLMIGTDRATLDALCAPAGTYQAWVPSEKLGYSNLRDDGAMSRQNSQQGYEAVPMSRGGTEQSSTGRKRRGI